MSRCAGEGSCGPREFLAIRGAGAEARITESDTARINSCPDTCLARETLGSCTKTSSVVLGLAKIVAGRILKVRRGSDICRAERQLGASAHLVSCPVRHLMTKIRTNSENDENQKNHPYRYANNVCKSLCENDFSGAAPDPAT